MKVKVLGAGSIGNHLSNAARRLGWSVDIIDPDPAALERTRTMIYPSRYGAWDEAIRLFAPGDAAFRRIRPHLHRHAAGQPHAACPRGGRRAAKGGAGRKAALRSRPRGRAASLLTKRPRPGVAVFVGYDHVVGRAARMVADLLASGAIGAVATIDVEFREHWGGIFAAHPWLAGPWESYLGFSARGGGASGEHSHAANLWQHFAHVAGRGRVVCRSTQCWISSATAASTMIGYA